MRTVWGAYQAHLLRPRDPRKGGRQDVTLASGHNTRHPSTRDSIFMERRSDKAKQNKHRRRGHDAAASGDAQSTQHALY